MRFLRKMIDVQPRLYNNVTGKNNIDGIKKRRHPFESGLQIKFRMKSIHPRIINGNSNIVNRK